MMMTRTLEGFCDGLMRSDSLSQRLEPDFPRFFGLSGRPTLDKLAGVFERAGIGQVSSARLPGTLRGIHYMLSNESYAIHYQEDQREGSSEYTLLHEAYEIVYETLGKRGHQQPSKRKVCLDADRFAAAAIRLGEMMDRQPLFVAVYERDAAGDPADWPEGTETHTLWAKAVKRTAGFTPPASPLLCGCRGGIPHRNSPIPSGSVAGQAVQNGRPEYAEEDGIAVVAKPVLWMGRVAKVAVVAVPAGDRCLIQRQEFPPRRQLVTAIP